METSLENQKSSPVMIARLAIMMFLQYISYGAILPIVTNYMKHNLHFGGSQIGYVSAAMAISALASPFVGSFLVDRFISAERMYVICHSVAAITMFFIGKATTFPAFFTLFVIYYAAYGPSMPLSNAIAFHHLPNERNKYGFVRVWGTIGWVFVAIGFSYLWLRDPVTKEYIPERLPDCFTLASITSVFMAAYSLTMPKRMCEPKKDKSIIPVSAFKVFANYKIAIIGFAFFMISAVGKYYYVGASIYLEDWGIQKPDIMPLMSIGQIPEIFAMVFLGAIVKKIGFKTVFLLGLVAELWRNTSLILGSNMFVLITGLFCHGLSYGLFITPIYIFLDKKCDKDSRSGAHQLFSILNGGCAGLVGNLLGGQCLDWFATNTGIDYRYYWAVPFVMTFVCFLLIMLVFKPTAEENSVE